MEQMDELACFAPGMLTLGTVGASPEKSRQYLTLAEEVWGALDNWCRKHIELFSGMTTLYEHAEHITNTHNIIYCPTCLRDPFEVNELYNLLVIALSERNLSMRWSYLVLHALGRKQNSCELHLTSPLRLKSCCDSWQLAWTCYNFYMSTPSKLAGENYNFYPGQVHFLCFHFQ